MNNYVVITTINPPTLAIEKFVDYGAGKLIVVGDRKTPSNWSYPNTEFFSFEDQLKSNYTIAKLLPANHYCRKMIGYLEAIQAGAEGIIDTDDDNIPYEEYGFPPLSGVYDVLNSHDNFTNIYQYFSDMHIWPRGLPLRLINTQFDMTVRPLSCNIGIWQGLANLDPDVDAIYRLTSDKQCIFQDKAPIVLPSGTVCPFNTQNTFIRKELFPLLYLPISVTFRYTDILRGLIAQPIMWLYGYQLGFTKATVYQERNPHDYFTDFISEVPMYLTTEKAIELVSNAISSDKNIRDNLYEAYSALQKSDIIQSTEMFCLEAWLKDIQNIGQ